MLAFKDEVSVCNGPVYVYRLPLYQSLYSGIRFYCYVVIIPIKVCMFAAKFVIEHRGGCGYKCWD